MNSTTSNRSSEARRRRRPTAAGTRCRRPRPRRRSAPAPGSPRRSRCRDALGAAPLHLDRVEAGVAADVEHGLAAQVGGIACGEALPLDARDSRRGNGRARCRRRPGPGCGTSGPRSPIRSRICCVDSGDPRPSAARAFTMILQGGAGPRGSRAACRRRRTLRPRGPPARGLPVELGVDQRAEELVAPVARLPEPRAVSRGPRPAA